MFVAHKIYAGWDGPVSGWLVYHLRPIDRGDQQVTPLGFVRNDGVSTWDDLRRLLPGVAYLGDVTVTDDQYRQLLHREVNPVHMRRVADAVEGN
jgi:hypothetical protein